MKTAVENNMIQADRVSLSGCRWSTVFYSKLMFQDSDVVITMSIDWLDLKYTFTYLHLEISGRNKRQMVGQKIHKNLYEPENPAITLEIWDDVEFCFVVLTD